MGSLAEEIPVLSLVTVGTGEATGVGIWGSTFALFSSRVIVSTAQIFSATLLSDGSQTRAILEKTGFWNTSATFKVSPSSLAAPTSLMATILSPPNF